MENPHYALIRAMLLALLVVAWRTRSGLSEIKAEFPVPATVAPAMLVLIYAGVFAAWAWL